MFSNPVWLELAKFKTQKQYVIGITYFNYCIFLLFSFSNIYNASRHSRLKLFPYISFKFQNNFVSVSEILLTLLFSDHVPPVQILQNSVISMFQIGACSLIMFFFFKEKVYLLDKTPIFVDLLLLCFLL